ncbi:hypothetical protein [Beijerinckia indica]|uniref:Flagellar FliJ protein n=1 Tax=Beijerinckia indica subsp. indica (strain ATCC 9039 / DSM 1715 / NCIMB 8712) TaxID=395963 RepID=B2IG72_BEII9|nr:hypothetical protein [Beijerinckia indica]ACB97146.1 hypothetical protein Bind_3590 [Beijerinckia indica subsp. indica ATCC 9039]
MDVPLAKARRIARIRHNLLRLAEWKKYEIDQAVQAVEEKNRRIIDLLQEGHAGSVAYSKMLLASLQNIGHHKDILAERQRIQAENVLCEQYRFRRSMDGLEQAQRREECLLEHKTLMDLIDVSQAQSGRPKSLRISDSKEGESP